MNIIERANYASELKATGKANCACAVVLAFKDQIKIDEEEIHNLTSGFSAGMGKLEGTCGALVGAIIVAGVLTGKGARYSREIFNKFESLSKATICKELKGIEKGQVLCECPKCVYNAVISLGEVLGL